MSFWDRTVEPKRTYRWVLDISTLGSDVQWVAKSVTRPSWNVTHHAHKFINHTFNYPGRVEWQPIEIKLIDPASPIDTSASFLKVLRSSGYTFPDSLDNAKTTITKASAVGALGSLRIRQIAENGNKVLDEWKLYNAFATNVTMGELNYEGDELIEIGMTIVYDWAYMTKSGSGKPGMGGAKLNIGLPNEHKHDVGNG